jgi:isopropylmalate/homocitrate/citramalate synthase
VTKRSIHLVDCTLREGDQAPAVWLTTDDKIAIFHLLEAVGVDVIDAGMPAVSAAEREVLAALSAIPGRRASVAASVRCVAAEVEQAAECGVDEVFIIYPVSRIHREQRLGTDTRSWLERGRSSLRAAEHAGLTANLVAEDASRAEWDDLALALKLAQEEGTARIMLCDTVGILTPAQASTLVRRSQELTDGRPAIGVHFHNDYGMATANTIAAIEAGANWPSVTVNGVGERAGNAVLAEVVMACKSLLDVTCAVRPDGLFRLSREVERRTGVFQSVQAPVVGDCAFAHESGMHVHGILRNPATYEALTPDELGRSRHIAFGKHSGRSGLADWAANNGLPNSDDLLNAVLARLKQRRPERYGRRIAEFAHSRDKYLEERRGFTAEELKSAFREVLAEREGVRSKR